MPGPRQNVSAPSFTPLPYGLLTTLSSDVRDPRDAHWQSGVTWESICAQGGTTYDECWAVTGTGSAPPPPDKTVTTAITQRGALPFTVVASIDCSAPGFWDRAIEIVGDTLTQSEQWQVERALWTGIAGGKSVVWPHLAANANLYDSQNSVIQLQTQATIVSGTSAALDMVEGLGLLEQELANCYDGVGVIHAPRVLIPAMTNSGIITRDGDRYHTAGGNIVVFGAGYSGSSPAGVITAGQAWMYATGAMFIYRSKPNVFPRESGFSRANNTLNALAERTYLIGWDCCQLAVNISTGGIVAGTAGAAN